MGLISLILMNLKQNEILRDKVNFDSDEIKENTIKEIGEINDTEVEIELMPLSLELIETCDSGDYDSISLKEMETLEFMIQE